MKLDVEEFEEFYDKVKTEGEQTLIGARSDHFHCDLALGTTMLLYTEAYKNSVIIRTRSQEVFEKLDISCGRGSKYEPEKHRYGHKYDAFTETWNNEETDLTRLSGAGLIYKHFGREVVSNAVQ